MPDVVDKTRSQGIEIASSTPEELAARQRNEITKWAKIVRESGMAVQ